jgi:hypothetical protein
MEINLFIIIKCTLVKGFQYIAIIFDILFAKNLILFPKYQKFKSIYTQTNNCVCRENVRGLYN